VQCLLARVVVVRKRARVGAVDRHFLEPVSVEDLPRHLGARHPGQKLDVRVALEGLPEPPLHGEPDDESRDEQQDVEPPVVHRLEL